MLDFKPPLDSPLLLWWLDLTLPLYLKLKLHDTQVKLVPGARERLEALKGCRAMICPNHSNRHDPQIMYTVGHAVNEHFNFVAAREVFDYDHGLNGWWLQHIGSYSVVRGAADRESFKTTRRVLSHGPKKLVLFPEGEISRQNDTLMALESGAAQLSLWALADLAKEFGEEKVLSGEKTIFIIPMAFKYTYPKDISSALGGMLKTLEHKMGLEYSEEVSLYKRMRQIAERLIAALEKEYHFKSQGSSLNERIKNLRLHILLNLAQVLQIELPEGQRELEHVRILRNKLDDYIYHDDNGYSAYEKEVHDEKEVVMKGYYKDLNRVVNFISIYDSYVNEHMTQERLAEVIDRLEAEILGGEPTLKGARDVLVDVGSPIDLSKYYADYKKDKKKTCHIITEEIYQQISTMLNKLEELRPVRFLSNQT